MLYRDCFLKIRAIFPYCIVLLLFQIVSCSVPQNYRIQPELINTLKNVKSIGVIVPTCIIQDLAIAGATTINKEASQNAKPIMERGVIGGLEKKGFKGWLITNDKDIQVFMRGYRPIAYEITYHFPGGQMQPAVPSSIEGFDDILTNNNIDCVLAVEGLENVSTPGRKAMLVARAATIVLGVGVFGGSGLTHISYNLFCAGGKPMYTDMVATSSLSIASQEDVVSVVGDMTERMLQLTNLSKTAPAESLR